MLNDKFIGGVLNLTGAAPGQGFQYDGPTMPSYPVYMLTFRTTYEAIEKYVLQPPLKADRSQPPIVKLWYFVNSKNRAFDGRPHPYHAIQFAAPCIYGDYKGQSGWEYVDGVFGDKTEVEIMGPWGVYFGMAKKMGDVSFVPLTPDEFQVSVDRKGARLITFQFKLGAELTEDELEKLNSVGGWPDQMTVRAIPNADYSAFQEHSICLVPTSTGCTIDRAWTASASDLKFGRHEPMDTLDEIPVLEVTGAFAAMVTTHKEIFTNIKVVVDLLKDGVDKSET